MKHNLQTIKVISIEELKAAIENFGKQNTSPSLDLADIVYLSAVVYGDQISKSEKNAIAEMMVDQEMKMAAGVINRLAHDPYLLKKYIEVAYFYLGNEMYSDYWAKVRNRLYRTLIDVYGHDLYSIGKVSLYGMRYELQKLKKLSHRQLCEWVAVNFPEQKHRIVEPYFLDKLDLWYVVNNHPQRKEIPESEYQLLYAYMKDNFYDLFVSMIERECDYENEYEVRKRYFFTLSMGDEINADVYRRILNEDFAADIPDDDSLSSYLTRIRY